METNLFVVREEDKDPPVLVLRLHEDTWPSGTQHTTAAACTVKYDGLTMV